MPESTDGKTLADRRAACRHERLVAVKFFMSGRGMMVMGAPQPSVTMEARWCLECGEEERPICGGGQASFTKLVAQPLNKWCESHRSYSARTMFYHERLHVSGLMDRFDAQGEWVEKAPGQGAYKVQDTD